MSHDALARSGKGKHTEPNSWFVGIAPRRNPDIVVAVLWENGNWGKNAATLAAQVIETFVEKQRKREGNLVMAKAPEAPPAGVGSDVPFDPSASPAAPVSNEDEKRNVPKPTARAGQADAVIRPGRDGSVARVPAPTGQ